MSAAPATVVATLASGRAQARSRSRFYLGMSIIMAAIVLAGFTPTLFGRAFFNVPRMPGHLYAHGLVLAGWFVMLVVQSSLISAGRPALHRQLGWATVICAILIPAAGMGTQLALPDRIRAAGLDMAPYVELIQTVFWLNLSSMCLFTGFVIGAVLLRKRGDVHKRLMIFATVAMIPPAAARIARWPVFGNTASDLSQPATHDVTFAICALLLLTGAVVVHDLISRRRVLPVTAIGAVLLLVGTLGAPLVAGAEWAKAIVWAVS